MLNDKMMMTQLVIVERRVLKGSLHTIPDVHNLFTFHRLELMARSLGSYSKKIVRELYVSYVATLRGILDRRSKPVKQDPLTDILVQRCWVDISSISIPRFLYGGSTDSARVPPSSSVRIQVGVGQGFPVSAEQRT